MLRPRDIGPIPLSLLAKLDERLHQVATTNEFGEVSEVAALHGVVLSAEQAISALERVRQSRTTARDVGCVSATTSEGTHLARLTDRFQLTPTEEFVIVIALAPELNRHYETIYAFLQDNVTQRYPTVDLASQLCLGDGLKASLAVRELFGQSAKLRRYGLVELLDATDGRTSLLGQGYHLVPGVVNYLLGIADSQHRSRDKESFSELADYAKRAGDLVRDHDGQPTLFVIDCKQPSRAKHFATAIADQLQIELELPGDPLLSVLQGAALWRDDQTETEWQIWLELASMAAPMAFAWESLPPPLPAHWRLVHLELPPAMQKLGQLTLTPNEVERSKQLATAKATWNGNQPTEADTQSAARQILSQKLADLKLGRYVRPRATLDALVLPEEAKQLVHHLCAQVRTRKPVLEDWNFASVISNRQGVKGLFHGPSGTGKTFGAEAIASELGLDLYTVDLSQVVSKYIGETEKQLAKLFDIAEQSGIVLFFDEADAIFGKRTELKDAHDRFANVEVSYLLQRMEAFAGISILATNLRQNMDDAFKRRFDGIVEFPFPGEEERHAIWRGLVPSVDLLQNDVSLEQLARDISLAGGSICNIILLAASLAADGDQLIGMKHFDQAARHEHQKQELAWPGFQHNNDA